MSSTAILFEDIFEVIKVNEHATRKFERIDRLSCKGRTCEGDLVIDVNCELFHVREGESINVALASTLSLDGTPDDGSYNPNMGPSLLDQFEYAMHGRVFKYSHTRGTEVQLVVSFGGLLMQLKGEQRNFMSLHMDQVLYILMRKGES